MKVLWRTHDDKPDTQEPVTALLSSQDEEGGQYLLGIFLWKRGHWINELSGVRVKPPYWWVPEYELVPDLPRNGDKQP